MESKQDIENSPLMQSLEQALPKMNFYRFCQLLELLYAQKPVLGCAETPVSDPLRFAPAADMSFPAGELKHIEKSPYLNRPTTVRTRFLGLYGVDSALPPALLHNIIRKEEGYQVMTDFLDMFNHRIITQYYRIWLKYHYPASFISGGEDPISRCLLGLAGMGISGCSEQIATPSSRFLSLLGLITQRTRTAEGIVGLVRVLIDDAKVEVQEFYPIWQTVEHPVKLGDKGQHKARLDSSTILGQRFKESNQTVHIKLTPLHQQQIALLLPGGQLHKDLMALLKAYLGYKVDAQITLRIQRQFLPPSKLTSNHSRLGQTASLNKQGHKNRLDDEVLVNLGCYNGFNYAVA